VSPVRQENGYIWTSITNGVDLQTFEICSSFRVVFRQT